MPAFVVEFSISGTADEIDGARAALSARLPGLRARPDEPGRPWVTVDAASSSAALALVQPQISSLPPDVYGRLRFSAAPASEPPGRNG